MGMFDTVVCKYPLPETKCEFTEFSTTSFETPCLRNYEIREDGSLWVERYWIDAMHWEPYASFTGEIRMLNGAETSRLEFSAYFVKGKLLHLELIDDRVDEDPSP